MLYVLLQVIPSDFKHAEALKPLKTQIFSISLLYNIFMTYEATIS